jgi:hypothetical protein
MRSRKPTLVCQIISTEVCQIISQATRIGSRNFTSTSAATRTASSFCRLSRPWTFFICLLCWTRRSCMDPGSVTRSRSTNTRPSCCLRRLQLEKYLKKKINVDDEIIRKIKTEPSHSNNLIQLADMVCGAIGRSYKLDKADRMTYRKIIGHRELGVQLWPKV